MIWAAIVAEVCAGTGWTWDYVAQHMDLPRLRALYAYWADHPPVHQMIAAFMGIKSGPSMSPDPAEQQLQAERLMAEVAMFPQTSNQK